MATIDLEREVKELKRRLEIAEAKIAQQAGHFEFISSQLRDVQLYIHGKFAEVDARFERVDARFDRVDAELAAVKADMNTRFDAMDRRFSTLETNIDALPRVIAEMLQRRNGA